MIRVKKILTVVNRSKYSKSLNRLFLRVKIVNARNALKKSLNSAT
jgi:hypothetical protein